MEVYLTIDSGNSRLKGALWSVSGPVCATAAVEGGCVDALVEALRVQCPDMKIVGALCCHVGSGASPFFQGEAVPVLTADTPMPIKAAYGTPGTLGGDRLAAAAGAWALPGGGPVMVADLGTAATYDYVDASGVYHGGNIAPGVRMRMTALHEHTAQLPEVSVDGHTPVWGNTTAEAIRSGAVRGVAAELEYYAGVSGGRAVVTGGDAERVISLTSDPKKFYNDPLLVLRGLKTILQYNEN